MTKISLCSI